MRVERPSGGPMVSLKPSELAGSRSSDAGADSRLPGFTLAGIILIWGLGPPVSKLITAPPLVTASVRFWVSVPILLVLLYGTGHRLTVATLRRTAVAGALFGFNMACVFAALQHASVAVMTVMQALQPGIVLILAGRWLGERATAWHVGFTLVGIGGVATVVFGNSPKVHSDALGVLFAMAAMLSFTGYYLINRRVRSTVDIHPLEWMTGSTIFSALAVTPLALAVSSPADYRLLGGADWLYLAFVTGAVGIFGHTMMSWVHRYVPASRSSLYLLGMTVVAMLAAWPIHDEPITAQQALGGLVVLGAVAAVVSRPPARAT